MFGKEAKKKELIKNLGQIYEQLQREHQISPGDFPDIKRMQVNSNFQCLCSSIFVVVTNFFSSSIRT